jgi:hypothetical protein
VQLSTLQNNVKPCPIFGDVSSTKKMDSYLPY